VDRTLKRIVTILIVILIAAGSFTGGFVTGHVLPFLDSWPFRQAAQQTPVPAQAPTPSAGQLDATPEELQALFAPFWESWNIVHEQYVDQPVDDAELVRGAIRGMLESLGDPHSSYMDPVTYENANAELSGEYEGIGAYVDTTTEFLTIISPMPGSPAEAAGIQSGDRIIAIDGDDMTGIDPELVRLKVVGPAGSTVRLTVARDEEAEPLEFEIRRERITVKAASGRILESQIAYVELTTFGDKTMPELRSALKEVMAQRPAGLILDLRNNGGGYLDTAVEVTSQFLGDGVVLYEQYGDGTRQVYEVEPGGLATKVPMIVLINEGSASASEIVAGALQDSGRAQLVGVTSYGKGTVQNWIPLSDDQGAVRITIATWLTPDERTIHDVGLTPDVSVEMTHDDRQAGRDPQLEEAVVVLLAAIAS
jgi:carboxyl-terminal processing protease